jgi:hypothetical protein
MIFSNSVSKLVKMGFILSLFFAFLTPAYAQTLGQSCDQTVGCDENYICNSNNVCATDPNLDAAPANANGTVEPGGKCSSPDNCDDVGGLQRAVIHQSLLQQRLHLEPLPQHPHQQRLLQELVQQVEHS